MIVGIKKFSFVSNVCVCVLMFFLVSRRTDGGSRCRCVGQLQREETAASLVVSVKSALSVKSMAEFCCTLSIVHTARHHATSSSLSVHFNSDDDHHRSSPGTSERVHSHL